MTLWSTLSITIYREMLYILHVNIQISYKLVWRQHKSNL